jgi:hypothetical protein
MPSVVNKIQDFSSSVSGNAVSGVNNVLIPLSAEPETNFDVTADWVDFGVTDQSVFESFLIGAGATSVNITYFDLTSGRLQAIIDVEGVVSLSLENIGITEVNKIGGFDSSLTEIYLDQNEIVNFNPSIPLPSSLQYLSIQQNQITTFNPSIALPSSLQNLDLDSNQITTFNPSIALPSGLQVLGLSGNQIVVFNPSIALPSTLEVLTLDSNQITTFNPSIALPSGLQVLGLSGNRIVVFNPSIVFPISLISLELDNNLMTTAGYSASEGWATIQPSFTNVCTVIFAGNANSVSGTNLETILLTKNTTIIT